MLGTILEKSHAFHLLLCIITADSNIISIPTQYIHLFPKFLSFFFFLAANWVAPLGLSHSYSKLKMFKTESIITSSTSSFKINGVLTYSLFSPFLIVQFYILNISQICPLNFSPNTMCIFRSLPNWNTNNKHLLTLPSALVPQLRSPGSHLGDLAKSTSDLVIPLLTFSHPKSPTGSSSEGQYGIQALQD